MKLGQLSDEITEGAEMNITPLIDIVFILLIFFVVTTTFVHELGLPVDRPEASTGAEQAPDIVRVAVSRQGEITVDARPTSRWRVEAEVRSRLRDDAHASVLLIADRDTVANVLVEVMDACRRAGAKNVALGVENGDAT
jgi:biopolymer transport protein ExbD